MDDYEIHRKAKNNNRLSGLLEASERYDSSSLSSNENGRTAGNIDSLDREALQAERQSDRYGYRKDADNDNTSKKRYSRDVDYAEYAYRYSPDFIFLKIKKRDSLTEHKG